MLKEIDIRRLKIGMYVILPLAWHEHSFFRNSFKVLYAQQIADICALGINKLTIDITKGDDISEDDTESESSQQTLQTQLLESIFPDALRDAISNQDLPPAQKAELIHEQSVVMMRNLLQNPSAENIGEAKKGIAQVVGLILKDDDTTRHLLKITSHDYYTFTHSVTVGMLAISLSKVLFKRSSGHNMIELGSGFFLHDVGKVLIDTAILNKPARLTDEEMQQIQRHPNLGFNLLNNAKQLSEEAKFIVLQHHEKYDGTGYPKRLKGESIHIYARICSLADVYDALTSDRPYRKALHPFNALKLMEKEMVGNFQRELFKEFVLLFK